MGWARDRLQRRRSRSSSRTVLVSRRARASARRARRCTRTCSRSSPCSSPGSMLGETPTSWQGIGAACIMGGLCCLTRIVKLVLFDIDGTILLTDGAGKRAVHRALIEVFGATGPGRPSLRRQDRSADRARADAHRGPRRRSHRRAHVARCSIGTSSYLHEELDIAPTACASCPAFASCSTRSRRATTSCSGCSPAISSAARAPSCARRASIPIGFASARTARTTRLRGELPARRAAARARRARARHRRARRRRHRRHARPTSTAAAAIGARAIGVATGHYSVDELRGHRRGGAFEDLVGHRGRRARDRRRLSVGRAEYISDMAERRGARSSVTAVRVGSTDLGEANALPSTTSPDDHRVRVGRGANAANSARGDRRARARPTGDLVLSVRDGRQIAIASESGDQLQRRHLVRRSCAPELTRTLRAFGSRRGQRRTAARGGCRPAAFLRAARSTRGAAASKVSSHKDMIAAFDAAALTRSLETTCGGSPVERFGQNGPARRALEAELVDSSEPLHVALRTLRERSTEAARSGRRDLVPGAHGRLRCATVRGRRSRVGERSTSPSTRRTRWPHESRAARDDRRHRHRRGRHRSRRAHVRRQARANAGTAVRRRRAGVSRDQSRCRPSTSRCAWPPRRRRTRRWRGTSSRAASAGATSRWCRASDGSPELRLLRARRGAIRGARCGDDPRVADAQRCDRGRRGDRRAVRIRDLPTRARPNRLVCLGLHHRSESRYIPSAMRL